MTRHSARALGLLPSFGFILYLLHPVTAFLHPETPLSDPGIGWHLATGRYVLERHVVPAHDLFSWTATGRRDVSFYWLFDSVGALLVDTGGLPLFAAACVAAYALLPYLLYRRMLGMGVGLWLAVGWTLVAYVALLSHALARPHVITYVSFLVLLDLLDRFDRGVTTARVLCWLPVLMLVWCNAHGGFLVGLLVTAVFAVVSGLRAVAWRRAPDIRQAMVLIAVLAAMLLATLANPSGVGLLQAAVSYFSLRSPAYFTEFQTPDFMRGGAGVRAFEIIALGLVGVLGYGGRRLRATEVATLVVLLHMALTSVRHMNLFVLAAAPILARELAPMLDRVLPALQVRARRLGEFDRMRRADVVWIPLVVTGFLVLSFAGGTPFPRTLEGPNLTAGAADFIAAHPRRFDRMFNTDNLGGALIWRFWPGLRVFVDDRVPVYGDEFVIEEYFAVFYARPRWREVLDRWHVSSAVVTASAPCAALLREAPEWTLAYEDAKNVIFFRRPATTS